MTGLVGNWVNERRRLFREATWIAGVEIDAAILVEELRRRRDSETPRGLALPRLEEALRRVAREPSS